MAPIVIVGAGMAGGRAFDVLRKKSDVPVILIGDEASPPYNRPDLSKRYLLDEIEHRRVLFHAPDHYQGDRTTFRASTAAIGLDPDAHELRLGDGSALRYGQLLLATGGAPRRLLVRGADLPGVHYLRTLLDALALRTALAARPRVTVVGAGLIGARQVGRRRRVWSCCSRLSRSDPAALIRGEP